MSTATTLKLGTVQSVDLHRILSDASLFASTDVTLPGINVVRLEFDKDQVLAIATDRFRLGVSRAKVLDGDEVSMSLYLDDVKRLIQSAKTKRAEEGWRAVDVTSDGKSVQFTFNDGSLAAARIADVDFPKFRGLFPKSVSLPPLPAPDSTAKVTAQTAQNMRDVLAKSRHATAFTAEYLASFGKVKGTGDRASRIFVYAHDSAYGYGQKPLTVTIGDDFVGLVMPVKFGDDDPRQWATPDWL